MSQQAPIPISKTKLPQFFPLMLPACKGVAETFFECFEIKGVEECKALMNSYEECMIKNGIEQKIKMVRVPDAYKKENR